MIKLGKVCGIPVLPHPDVQWDRLSQGILPELALRLAPYSLVSQGGLLAFAQGWGGGDGFLDSSGVEGNRAMRRNGSRGRGPLLSILLCVLMVVVAAAVWTDVIEGAGSPVMFIGDPRSSSPGLSGLVTLKPNAQGRERYQVQGGGPVLVAIPAGRFKMGSPPDEEGRWPDEVPREVVLSQGFLLGEAPVTQADFAMVMRTRPSGRQGSARPVERVSWLEAVQYCNALSRGVGLEEAYVMNGAEVVWKGLSSPGFRLPTEAEWEYACRAGTKDEIHPENLDNEAWYDLNSEFETHPVRWKQPNAWGLHDMIGNVWEWCWDWYGNPGSGPTVDPLGPDSGTYRVNRGGSWRGQARCARAACRSFWPPDCHNDDLGFRVARSLP